MLNADAISRIQAENRDYISNGPVKTVEELITERLDVFVVLTVDKRVTMAQQADRLIKQIKMILQNQMKTKLRARRDWEIFIENTMVEIFVMLKSIRKNIAMIAHDLSEHPALDITINNVIRNFWFSKLRRSI